MSRGARALVGTLSLMGAAVLGVPATAGETLDLLPSDPALVVSINLRQILREPAVQKSAGAQAVLDGLRLALKGDQQRLKKFYASHAALLKEQWKEEDFLERAKEFKNHWDSRGVDPLEDLDRMTLALVTEREPHEVIVWEGRFQLDRVKAAAKARAGKNADAVKISRAGDFEIYEWSEPGQPPACVAVSPKVIVTADTRKRVTAALDRLAGKAKGGLTEPTRTLIALAREEHFGLVVNSTDVFFRAVEAALKQESVAREDVLGRWARDQALAWSRQFGKDVTVMSVGLAFKAEEFRLQVGMGTPSPRVARAMGAWIERANFWAAPFLSSSNNDVPRLGADILRNEKVSVKGSAAVVQVAIPYKFVTKVLEGPWP